MNKRNFNSVFDTTLLVGSRRAAPAYAEGIQLDDFKFQPDYALGAEVTEHGCSGVIGDDLCTHLVAATNSPVDKKIQSARIGIAPTKFGSTGGTFSDNRLMSDSDSLHPLPGAVTLCGVWEYSPIEAADWPRDLYTFRIV